MQWINRPDADFRGASGMVASGEVRPGMPVTVLPSGRTSQVARIVTYDGDLAMASAGQSVTLTLQDDLDVSRGDVIAASERPPVVTDRLSARVVWMNDEPLVAGRCYILKLGTSSTIATARGSLRLLDLDSGQSAATTQLAANEIGQAAFALDRRIALDPYADNRVTGAFILIDWDSYDTVAMGTVEREPPARLPARVRDFLFARKGRPPATAAGTSESHARSIAKAVSWRVTGSLDTFILTLLITGSGVWASSIAATEIVTKIVAYYFHERIWSLVRWGHS